MDLLKETSQPIMGYKYNERRNYYLVNLPTANNDGTNQRERQVEIVELGLPEGASSGTVPILDLTSVGQLINANFGLPVWTSGLDLRKRTLCLHV
jgi:hypothetical protein